MSKLVLVIEDDIDINSNIKYLLESEGYNVHSVFHGAAGLEYLCSVSPKPDAITLDLMMPVMDGWEFRKKQLELDSIRAIPVIVISAANSDFSSLKYNYFVRKPFDLDKFLEAVEKAVL